MSVESMFKPEWPEPTRRRMLDAAMKLFAQYSFAGTSLQMIADELGLTKAAIYYHFRTRDDLLVALMQPMFQEITRVVDTAGRKRGARARAESMLEGYAEIVASNRSLTAVTVFDPSVGTVLRRQREWAALIERQLTLLAAVGSVTTGGINAAVVMTGLAGAASAADHLTDDELSRQLVVVGRGVLGLPNPAP